jgi:hypothetical protein
MIPIQFIHYLSEAKLHSHKFRFDMRVKAIKSDCDGAMKVANIFTLRVASIKVSAENRFPFFFFGKTIFKINLSPSRKFSIHVILLS